jgi:hypothetical protein
MLTYLNIAIAFCKMTGTGPSFLLHPLDLLGDDQVPELAFFPGMDLSEEQKLLVLNNVLKILSKHFDLVNMSTHACSIMNINKLKMVHL